MRSCEDLGGGSEPLIHPLWWFCCNGSMRYCDYRRDGSEPSSHPFERKCIMSNIKYTEIGVDGSVTELSEEDLNAKIRHRFFTWITEVGKIANWTNEETATRVEDVSWFFCYDDGLTPLEAYNEAKSKGIV